MQQVIDGILYSPVLAHSLRRGDLFTLPRAAQFKKVPTRRILGVMYRDADQITFRRTHPRFDHGTAMTLDLNAVVLRAVGAGVGGVA